jgi:hypothetical protein
VQCEIRDQLIKEHNEALAASSIATKALAEVAGKLAVAGYKVLLLNEERCEAKTKETLAALNTHRHKHGY